MCFSATASFTTSAVLIPIGLYTLQNARRHDRHYLVLAAFPLIFAIQQAIEGFLWLVLEGQISVSLRALTQAYLFFAYFLWPGIVPLAVFFLEPVLMRKRWFGVVSIIGFAFSGVLYLPLLFSTTQLSVSIVQGSILYEPALLYDLIVSRNTVRVFYALLVSIPLIFCSLPAVRIFGQLIMLSVLVSAIVFNYAFVSIWCFFAAMLSIWILIIFQQTSIQSTPLVTKPGS